MKPRDRVLIETKDRDYSGVLNGYDTIRVKVTTTEETGEKTLTINWKDITKLVVVQGAADGFK